jgi:hypothetical protein
MYFFAVLKYTFHGERERRNMRLASTPIQERGVHLERVDTVVHVKKWNLS